MHIDSYFDSGNIEVVDITGGVHAKLRIRKDAGDEHMQWFYFRVDGAAGQACTLQIINAGDASYPKPGTVVIRSTPAGSVVDWVSVSTADSSSCKEGEMR